MPSARIFTTPEAPAGVLNKIRRLLELAFDDGFFDDDWEHTLGGWHVVIIDDMEDDMAPVAHAAVVPRVLQIAGRPWLTGYVEGVATTPGRQGEGLGSLAMSQLAPILRDNFEIGALSTGRHDFYARLGWERWRGPSFTRRGRQLTRTADDDDGLMVLRFGPSRDLDLRAGIVCESRTGDDW